MKKLLILCIVVLYSCGQSYEDELKQKLQDAKNNVSMARDSLKKLNTLDSLYKRK